MVSTLLQVQDSGEIDVLATQSSLLAEYPALSEYPLERMLHAIEATVADIRPGVKKKPQFLWLFMLAGSLKGFLGVDDQKDEDFAFTLFPLVQVFTALLQLRGMLGSKNRIDWFDDEAVEIEWLQAWSARKLPSGSNAIEDAFEIAKANPLQLTGNRYLIVIINMGFALQTQNDPFPFILPVNSKVARTLGTTVPTVGSAISKAIRDGYFVVVEHGYSASTKRARLFRFNFNHPSLAESELIPHHT